MAADLRDTQVVVLAGGLGTRLAPVLGANIPKLLAQVDGRPYLSYFLDWMAGFGVTHVTLCLGHLADAVVAHLSANPPPIKVDWVVEPSPMGTAGALRYGRAAFRTDPVLICNGDSFTDADLTAFLAHHRRGGAPGTMLCTQVPDTSRYGRVALDGARRITGFSEKGVAGPGYINAGIYLLSADMLDAVAASQARSLESEIFAALPPATLAAFTGAFHFIDIGTPDSFRSATSDMLRRS